MKLNSLILLFSIATLSSSAMAATVCQTYKSAVEQDVKLKILKKVDPQKARLTKEEMGMVQTAVLLANPETPVTPAQALNIFKDVDGEGSNSGYITYTALPFRANTLTIARVTYYPGDNEYGALFNVGKTGQTVDLIAQIQDGDVVCTR